MRWFALVLAAMTLDAADFNGRWIFTVQGDPRGRSWWLKVDGDKGEFVGAPGGQLDPCTRIAVEGKELVWEVKNNHYRAHLEGTKLVGAYEVEGKTKATFTALRAPDIKD